MHDLLIRGARVVDGTGAPAITAEVALHDGRVVGVGRALGKARQVVDADGLALMPGIVDVHTHYDAQITWDRTLSPSPALGVTTAVMGNCGFGIAPCPQPQRETMLKNLSVVEGMDLDALLTGTRWEFESFSEYLDQLRRIKPYANVAALAGHSTIRTAVMGDEASTREEADDGRTAPDAGDGARGDGGRGDRPCIVVLPQSRGVRRAPDALDHRAGRGAARIGAAAARKGARHFRDGHRRARDHRVHGIARGRHGRPAFMVTVLTMYNDAAPDVALGYYERCAEARARGHEVYIHTSCQPLSFDFTLRESVPPLLPRRIRPREGGAALTNCPSIYADPAFRRRFRENLAHPRPGILFYGDWSKIEVDERPVTRTRACKPDAIRSTGSSTFRSTPR